MTVGISHNSALLAYNADTNRAQPHTLQYSLMQDKWISDCNYGMRLNRPKMVKGCFLFGGNI